MPFRNLRQYLLLGHCSVELAHSLLGLGLSSGLNLRCIPLGWIHAIAALVITWSCARMLRTVVILNLISVDPLKEVSFAPFGHFGVR